MGIISSIFPNRKKKFLTKIDQSINKVKHGTYNYLFMDLLEKYERETAGKLAAAVTNNLFNEKPVGKEATDYYENNVKLIQNETLALKGNKLIGNMVADAVQIKANIVYNNQQSGSVDHNFGKALETLKLLGFLKKQEEIASPKLFLVKANKYFSTSLNKVKYL